MANPLMFRKRQLASKIETTYGTAIALAAANAVDRVMDPKIAIVRPGILLDNQGGSGVGDVIPGDAYTTLDFSLHCNGGVTAPDWFKYIESCGYSLSGGTLTKTDTTSSWSSLTAGLFRDGKYRSGRGIMGNAKFAFVAGKPVVMTYNGVGGFVANPTDVSLLTGVTYNTLQPPVWAGAGSFTFDGVTTVKVSKLDLDLGNTVKPREDPNSAGGYIGGWIDNPIPRVTMDPESTLVAVRSYAAAQSAGTPFDMTLVAGTVSGSILTWTLGACKVENVPDEDDRDGKAIDNVSFVVTGAITLALS